jgi:hypothetical protein
MKSPDGSAAGDAFVICGVPATRVYAGGTNRHFTRPVRPSIASVRPYVVVT